MPKITVFLIKNYCKYRHSDKVNDIQTTNERQAIDKEATNERQAIDKLSTRKRHTNDKLSTTIEERKERKKRKKRKNRRTGALTPMDFPKSLKTKSWSGYPIKQSEKRITGKTDGIVEKNQPKSRTVRRPLEKFWIQTSSPIAVLSGGVVKLHISGQE